MNDRSYIALSMLAGAVAGGLAGFLLFTERGRRLRAEIQPHLSDLMTEARKLQAAVGRMTSIDAEEWRPTDEFVGDLGEQGSPWPGTTEGAPSH